MASDMLVFDSIAGSNLPSHRKNALYRWYEQLTGTGGRAISKAKTHVAEGGKAVVSGGAALLTGGVLGVAHAEMPNGLDWHAGHHVVPLDGAAGVLALFASVWLADNPVAAQGLNSMATTSLGVFAFRKSNAYVANKKLAAHAATAQLPKTAPVPTTQHAGEYTPADFSGDPVVAAARNIRQ